MVVDGLPAHSCQRPGPMFFGFLELGAYQAGMVWRGVLCRLLRRVLGWDALKSAASDAVAIRGRWQ